jgi:hypothetical protein
MSVEKLRKKNIQAAKSVFKDFVAILEGGKRLWVWQKKKRETTLYVLSLMSFLRFFRDEYVFFNKKYLKDALGIWKELAEDYPKVKRWIRIYEERLKMKQELGEIGEHIVDLSSSVYPIPVCFSMAVEYESETRWGSIITDFRKLLNVLAPLKVGIFHLPTFYSTSKVWVQEQTGDIKWLNKVLDGSKPEQLINDIKTEIKRNELENPDTVYLVILIRALYDKINIYGYLLWRETTGEVNFEKLPMKI